MLNNIDVTIYDVKIGHFFFIPYLKSAKATAVNVRGTFHYVFKYRTSTVRVYRDGKLVYKIKYPGMHYEQFITSLIVSDISGMNDELN